MRNLVIELIFAEKQGSQLNRTMDKIIVRKAWETDYDFILEAHAAIAGVSKQKEGLSKNWIENDILCKKPKAKVLIATIDNRPVGMILYALNYFAGDGAVVWVSQLYVAKEFRGIRVARALLEALRDKNKDSVGIVWATTPANNRAYKFFELKGAKALKEFTLFYKDWKF